MPRPEPTPARERQQRSAARAPGAEAASACSATWIQDHLHAVYRYARRRLSVADAEDVVQQSFEALRELVHTALGLKRGSDAALLRERYRRGVPVAESAQRRGITTKAAELRLRRARAAFAARFRKIGRDWVDGADDRPSDDVGRAT